MQSDQFGSTKLSPRTPQSRRPIVLLGMSTSILLCGTVCLAALLPLPAIGATPQFSGLNQTDVDNINREMVANSSWHSVTTPSTLGSLWGFEVGVIGGITDTPEINNQAQKAAAGTDVKMIPHAGLLGAVTFPGSLTLEALYIPKINSSGIDYQQYGGAIKWTPTDELLILPVNISARVFLAKSQLAFSQNVTDANSGFTVPAHIQQASQVSGFQIFASPKLLPIIEPYLGLGYLSGKGNLNADVVNTSVFANSSVSPDSSVTSTQLLLGLEVRLLLLAFGAEYERSFSTSSITGKVSFKF